MPQAIGELIPKILRQATHAHQTIQQIQRRWPGVVGKTLAAHTKPVSLRQGKLYVHADEPGASFALSLKKAKLLEPLQAISGRRIEDIVIRAGELT